MPDLPAKLNVLLGTRAAPTLIGRVQAIDPERLNVINAWPDLYDELQATWSPRFMERLAGPKPSDPEKSAAEKAAMLHEAHVFMGGIPYPREIKSRTPNMIWAHFGFAGTSNLKDS